MGLEYGFIDCFNGQLCAKSTKSVKTAVGVLLDNCLSRKPPKKESFPLHGCRLGHNVTAKKRSMKSNLSQMHEGQIVFVFLAKNKTNKKSYQFPSCHPTQLDKLGWYVVVVVVGCFVFFFVGTKPHFKKKTKKLTDTSRLGANLLFMNREQLRKKIRLVAFVVTRRPLAWCQRQWFHHTESQDIKCPYSTERVCPL